MDSMTKQEFLTDLFEVLLGHESVNEIIWNGETGGLIIELLNGDEVIIN
jgi:hypothetical protein